MVARSEDLVGAWVYLIGVLVKGSGVSENGLYEGLNLIRLMSMFTR